MSIAGTTTRPASATAGHAASSALTSLAGDFNDFLSLLTTQLQNQDPTSPMDTSQFTSQLVQFTEVAEQISGNSTLTSILGVGQTQQLAQASALVGQQVTFTGGTLPLQNGSAQVDYQTTSAGPVQVTVTNSSGVTVGVANRKRRVRLEYMDAGMAGCRWTATAGWQLQRLGDRRR